MDFPKAREALLERTKKQLQDAVSPDLLIIQSLASSDELTMQLNHLSKRLREWAGYVFPETEHAVSDHERFARLLAEGEQDEIRLQFCSGTSMGKNLAQPDWQALKNLATRVADMYTYREELLNYLETVLKRHNPNVHALLGTTIAARLISGAGSRRRLAILPASTLQLLGAEKALFRHLKSGARSPKHGHIINHQLIQQARRNDRGKIARALADKAAICAKLDYFEGDFLGDTYLKDLQKRFS